MDRNLYHLYLWTWLVLRFCNDGLDVTEVNKIWNEISMTLCPTVYLFFFMFMIFKRKSNRELICNTNVSHDLRICHDPEVRFMAISPTSYLCKGLFENEK